MTRGLIMEWTVCLLLTCSSLLLTTKSALAASKADYYNLYAYLFEHTTYPYKKNIRPAMNQTHVIKVEVDFYLASIIDVDEKEQTLVTSGTLLMSWEDSYLAWESQRYGDIQDLLVPQSLLYLPDVIVGNSVRATAQLGYPQQQIRLTARGAITWEPNLLLVTSCDIDITYFPFDTQICHVQFETAVSSNSEILLKMTQEDNSFSLEEYSPNGQWQLIAIDAEDENEKGYKASVRFGLQLKRRKIFYVLNLILPVFFLSLTSSLVFAIPADEGEKMGTSITVLLSFAVYLTIVSDLVPNTSLQVSVLALYLTTLLGQCAISVVVCTFILRLHFRDTECPVGPKTTKITRFFQGLMCYKTTNNKIAPIHREDSQVTVDESKPESVKLNNYNNGHNNNKKKMNEYVDSSKDAVTWKDVAKMLDDLCFILFSLLSVGVTVICLLVLVVGGQMNAIKLQNPVYL